MNPISRRPADVLFARRGPSPGPMGEGRRPYSHPGRIQHIDHDPGIRRAGHRQRRARHRRQAPGGRLALVALLCQGHVLIEDVPGTGKTMLAKAIARQPRTALQAHPVHARPAADRRHRRVDLQPEDQEFEFRPGPVMAQIVLADEINRATPKTQSALLEAMEERQVTIDGVTYPMPAAVPRHRHAEPDRVRGHLPAARGAARPLHAAHPPRLPAPREEIVILDEQKRVHPIEALDSVATRRRAARPCSPACARSTSTRAVSDYIVRLVDATRNHPDVYLGASPRGSLALYRAGPGLGRAGRPRLRHPRRHQGPGGAAWPTG